jgi:hypothetical protein
LVEFPPGSAESEATRCHFDIARPFVQFPSLEINSLPFMRFTQVTNVSDGDGPAVAVITDASVTNIEKSAAIVTLELSNLETFLY